MGSRTPMSRSASSRTKEKAPPTEGSTATSASSRASATSVAVALGVARAGTAWASSSATRSLSEATTPGKHAGLLGQRGGVGQVAVVAEGEAGPPDAPEHRLGVASTRCDPAVE